MLKHALKISVCLLLFISCITAQVKDKPIANSVVVKNTEKKSSKSNYRKMWKKVDKLEKSTLTRSAKNKTEEIFRKAKKDNNQTQVIKSLLVKYALQSSIDEDIETVAIDALKQEIASAEVPYKNILISILAEAYDEYFKKHRDTFYQRTHVADTTFTEDFKTWDARRFHTEISRLYLNSLGNSEQLKISSAKFAELLIFSGEELSITYSTLLDVLTGRALKYFMNTESSVTQPEDVVIKNADYLSVLDDFVKLKLDNSDTLSITYQTCRLFQMLLSYHKNMPDDILNQRTLAQIDVMRLKYIHDKGVMKDKDSLLITTIKKSIENSSAEHASAVYGLILADYYYTFSKVENYPDYKILRSKASAICDSLMDKYPAMADILQVKALKREILKKSLGFHYMDNVAAEKPFSVLVDYKNIKTLYASIIPVTTVNERLIGAGQKKLLSNYHKLKGVILFSRNLDSLPDNFEHSVEISLPPLKRLCENRYRE